MPEVSLDEAPRKARDLFDKGFAALERGNLDYAMDILFGALEIEPKLLQARKFLRAAQVRKFKESGSGSFKHLVTSLSGLPTLLAAKASMKKKPLHALASAEKLMRMDPLNKSFMSLLDHAAVAAGMPEVAIQTLEIAKEHYPNDIPLIRRLAKLYLDTNQPQQARSCYEDVMRLKPNDPKALKDLKDASALDTMKKGGWSEASSYRDVMKDGKEAVLLEQEAKAVKSGKDLEVLIRDTRAKVQREPDNVNYKRTLADLYTKDGQLDKALEVLKEALETTGRADPQIERGIALVRVKQFDVEIARLESAGNAAAAKAKAEEKDRFLLTDATDRVQRYPNDLQFRYDLGVLLFQRGQLNEAIREFQISQRNPQRRTRSLYYMALCFKHKNQHDIAMEQLEKASSELHVMDDTKKDILYEMGIISELMKQPAKAAGFFKEIYSVDIGFKDVASRIEKAYEK